ncbi:uncharacterized protein LOC144527102 [Sander vitreus]
MPVTETSRSPLPLIPDTQSHVARGRSSAKLRSTLLTVWKSPLNSWKSVWALFLPLPPRPAALCLRLLSPPILPLTPLPELSLKTKPNEKGREAHPRGQPLRSSRAQIHLRVRGPKHSLHTTLGKPPPINRPPAAAPALLLSDSTPSLSPRPPLAHQRRQLRASSRPPRSSHVLSPSHASAGPAQRGPRSSSSSSSGGSSKRQHHLTLTSTATTTTSSAALTSQHSYYTSSSYSSSSPSSSSTSSSLSPTSSSSSPPSPSPSPSSALLPAVASHRAGNVRMSASNPSSPGRGKKGGGRHAGQVLRTAAAASKDTV